MSKSWARTGETYEIETDVYNGPLDLLLDLIQKAELDITKLAIATVTDQFLSYVEQKQQKKTMKAYDWAFFTFQS